MKKILTIVIVLLSSTSMYAQGYTWEWSPRAPQTMPTTFVGIEVTGGYAQHQGDLPYVEELITCCTFESGTGTPFRIAVFGERWVLPKTALSAGFGVTFQGGTFTSDPIRLVRENNSFLVTEYRMQVQQTQMVLQLGARQRLFNSFLSVGVGVAGLVNLGGTADVSQSCSGGRRFCKQIRHQETLIERES